MKTPRTLQTKRSRPKAGFRMLHAATRITKKRKQRAATTASPEEVGEVPGVGVPLALVVILLLHVAAIAGIWLHDRWSDGADLEASKPALKEAVPPTRNPNLESYLVNKGDTLESIAQDHGVSSDSLARANGGMTDFQAGWPINLPSRRVERRPINTLVVENTALPEEVPYGPNSRPTIQTRANVNIPGSEPGPLVEVEGANEPILVTPEPRVNVAPPRETTVRSNRRTHVVKSGETLWRIARNNGVSVADLERANPSVNVRALRIGAKLVIPSGR